MIRALVTGMAAALLAGAAWYVLVVATNARLGIASVGVGVLVGLGTAYEQDGHDRVPLQMIAVTLTLVTLFFAEYFIVRHAAMDLLHSSQFRVDVPLFMSPSDMVQVVQDDISADPILLLFWAIAAVQAWIVPAKGAPFVGARAR